MNAIQVRAAVFAVLTNQGLWRRRKHDGRRWNAETKKRCDIDEESLKKLRVKSERVVTSLERHMKLANRHLLTLEPPEDYAALMDAWKKHLRWMRLRLVYFKPRRPVLYDRRIKQRKILDEFVSMAEQGLCIKRVQPPEAKELRRMMRLFVASSRRGREGPYGSIPYLLKHTKYSPAQSVLADFVRARLDLKVLPPL